MVLKINSSYTYERIFTIEDVKLFANLSGDINPIHLNEEYAKKTIFKTRIVHGLFASSIFSMIIGTKFPGEGSIYLEQNLKFIKPIYPKKKYLFTVKVTHIREDKPIYTLSTICTDEDQHVFIEGNAIVLKK